MKAIQLDPFTILVMVVIWIIADYLHLPAV